MFFVAGVGFEPDGGADEAEGGADLVGEEALEGEVELDVAVGEEDKGRRGDGGLGHVIDFDAAVHGDEARWKSTVARKRFIAPVVTRLRRSRATSSTFLKSSWTPRPVVAETKTSGA